jgi:hypothetical protein
METNGGKETALALEAVVVKITKMINLGRWENLGQNVKERSDDEIRSKGLVPTMWSRTR